MNNNNDNGCDDNSKPSIQHVDIVCGLAWGDEAKGKITSELVQNGAYQFVCRWAGGNNAGHTVFVKDKRYKTHSIPCGVFHNIPSIIGPGCVVHTPSFLREIEYLTACGFDTSCVKISPRAHVITESHVQYDQNKLHGTLGTTGRGISPCYSDKALKRGILCKDEPLLKDFMWDEQLYGNILCEGAQGFWLDIDKGNYPYNTSSTTIPYAACSLGFPPQYIRRIYGAAKIYDTRSGHDPDFPETLLEDPLLSKIIDDGKEYGVTTGRKRKVNWLNMDKLLQAIQISGSTHIIVSKVDVLQNIGIFKIYKDDTLHTFETYEQMQCYIAYDIQSSCKLVENVVFSASPCHI